MKGEWGGLNRKTGTNETQQPLPSVQPCPRLSFLSGPWAFCHLEYPPLIVRNPGSPQSQYLCPPPPSPSPHAHTHLSSLTKSVGKYPGSLQKVITQWVVPFINQEMNIPQLSPNLRCLTERPEHPPPLYPLCSLPRAAIVNYHKRIVSQSWRLKL